MSIDETPRFNSIQKYIPLLIWIICISTLLMIPLKIREYGYAPIDDAHRHIGKAISGKPWNEILVMREDITIDTNCGWHKILGFLHHNMGWDAETLMTFSISGLFLILAFTGLAIFQLPESWMAALLVFLIPYQGLIVRLTRGRPYIFSMAILFMVLAIWRQNTQSRKNWGTVLVTTVLIACATWIHGSWYLWGIVVVAFFLSRRFKDTLYLGISWICGSIIGACLTGTPVNFLWQQLRWAFDAFGRHEIQRVLVLEFQPSSGDPRVVFLIVLLLFLICIRENNVRRVIRDPVFMLLIIGWLFGLATKRFWIDWGLPSGILWFGYELQRIIKENSKSTEIGRLGITCFVALALYLGSSSDLEGRWTSQLMDKYLDENDPELSGWLPDENGIIYSADMRDFYRTFFANPHANWRYVLGYEPAIMREDDLTIYRDIQWNYGITDSYLPWVEKMTSADRLFIEGNSRNQPDIPDLEWKFVGGYKWIGRLPSDENVTSDGFEQ